MAKRDPTASDITTGIVTASFTAQDQVTPWMEVAGRFWLSAQPAAGGGVGSVVLEFSLDGGTTPQNASMPSGAANSWPVPVLLAPEAPTEAGCLARLRCGAYTSGSINARLSR